MGFKFKSIYNWLFLILIGGLGFLRKAKFSKRITILVRKIDKKAAYLMIPYLAWVTFAGVLNYLSII